MSSNDEQVELLEGNGGLLCDPRRSVHKFIMLFVICFLTFGSYFCYDNPAALESHMIETQHLSYSSYAWFYSIYSFPNMINSFIGGFLIDNLFGLRLGAIIFATCCFVGHVVFATGTFVDAYAAQLVGRFIFGLGGENLAVCSNSYAIKHYKDSGFVNLVFGVLITTSRVGNFVNLIGMPWIYNQMEAVYGETTETVGRCFFIACGFAALSVVCAVTLMFMDRRIDRIMDRKVEKQPAQWSDLKKVIEVKDFPMTFWAITLVCVFYYIAVFPFVSLGMVLYIQKWNYDASKADFANSFVYIISAIFSPVAGAIVDKTGRNIVWIGGASLLAVCAHGLLAFTFVTPFIALSILGLSISIIASSLWPLVASTVPDTQLATAYGVMQSIQNTGLAIAPIIIGQLMDSIGFMVTGVFYILMLCLTILSVVFLNVADTRSGGLLNISGEEKKRRAAALKTE